MRVYVSVCVCVRVCVCVCVCVCMVAVFVQARDWEAQDKEEPSTLSVLYDIFEIAIPTALGNLVHACSPAHKPNSTPSHAPTHPCTRTRTLAFTHASSKMCTWRLPPRGDQYMPLPLDTACLIVSVACFTHSLFYCFIAVSLFQYMPLPLLTALPTPFSKKKSSTFPERISSAKTLH